MFYYRRKRRLHPELYQGHVPIATAAEDGVAPPAAPPFVPVPLMEQTPLLSAFSASGPSEEPLSPALQRTKDVISYAGGFVLIVVVGLIAYAAGKKSAKNGRTEEVWDTSAQVVGWISAFLYRTFPSFLTIAHPALARADPTQSLPVNSRLPAPAAEPEPKDEVRRLVAAHVRLCRVR